MIDIIALVLFFTGLVTIVGCSLAGKVHLSLMMFVPLIPLQNVLYRFHKFPMGKDFIDIVLIAMLAGWIIRSLISGERLISPTPFNKLLIVLVLFTYVSLWHGSYYLNIPAPVHADDLRLQTWKNYMILPLLYFLTVNNIKSVTQMKWLAAFMFASILIADLYTAKQIVSMTSLASRDRLTGTFVFLGPNQVAAFYVTYIFMLLGIIYMYRDKLYRLLAVGLMAPAAGVMLFLYSRGAYAGIIAGLIFVGLVKKRLLLIPLFLILAGWQIVLPKTVIDRVKETRTTEGTLDSSSQRRIDLWKESMGLFSENPMFGIGFDAISARGLLYGFRDTHNIYVKVLAEQGLIGITLFVTLLIKAFYNGYRLFRESEDEFLQGIGLGFSACVIGVLVTNIFGDRWTFLQVGAYLWVFMGMVSRGLILTEENDEKEYDSETGDDEEELITAPLSSRRILAR